MAAGCWQDLSDWALDACFIGSSDDGCTVACGVEVGGTCTSANASTALELAEREQG